MAKPIYHPHNYVIHPLLIQKQTMPEGWFTYMMNYQKPIEMYIGVFYIAGIGKHVLVDTGGSAATALKRGVGEFTLGAEDIATPAQALKKVGITPDDIDMIIMTHLHFDHSEYIKEFKKAKVVIQKAELDFAYNPGLYKGMFAKWMWEGADIMVVDGDVELFPGIWVLFTPGHTAGSQSVLIDTEKGRVIICGICAVDANFNPPEVMRKVWQVIPAGIHTDAREAYDSMVRIKEMADIVVTMHDPKTFEQDTIP